MNGRPLKGDKVLSHLRQAEDSGARGVKHPAVVTIGDDPGFLRGLLSFFGLSDESVYIDHVARKRRPTQRPHHSCAKSLEKLSS